MSIAILAIIVAFILAVLALLGVPRSDKLLAAAVVIIAIVLLVIGKV